MCIKKNIKKFIYLLIYIIYIIIQYLCSSNYQLPCYSHRPLVLFLTLLTMVHFVHCMNSLTLIINKMITSNLIHNISLATSTNENVIFIFIFFYYNYNFFTVKTSKFRSQRWYILNRLAMTAHIRQLQLTVPLASLRAFRNDRLLKIIFLISF